MEMKKKNFITLLVGCVSGMLFALGMCMCLLPEWNAFTLGVVLAAIGFVALTALFLVRFKMDGRKITFNWPLIGKIAFGTLGALTLGLGMAMIMVWKMMLLGIIVGIVGIVLLICLLPMCLGLKNED